jgi:hypothetical protein
MPYEGYDFIFRVFFVVIVLDFFVHLLFLVVLEFELRALRVYCTTGAMSPPFLL